MNDIKSYYKSLNIYKKAFWLYIILLFVEGMFRKWFMPSASNAWMIVREPIVIWIVCVGLSKGWIKSLVAKAFMIVGIITFFTALIFGHHNLFIAFYGARIWVFHMPFIFIMARVLAKNDLKMVLKFLIIIFILATPLYLIQFLSPPNTMWNASVGGEMSSAQEAAYGAVRPSGPFANGVSSAYFNPLMFSIILAVYFSTYYRKIISRNVFVLFLIAIAVTLVTSVSRGTIIQSGLTLIVVSVWLQMAGQKSNIIKLSGLFAILFIFIFVFQNTEFGTRLLTPITQRFQDASSTEGGAKGIFISRIIGPYLWFNGPSVSLLGQGVGMSSNFAAKSLSGEYHFLLGEWSSQQYVGEMGIFFGSIIFFLRICFPIYLMTKCYRSAKYRGELLPIAIWPFAFASFANGHFNLTSTLGFVVLAMILLLVALKNVNGSTANRIFRHR